MEETDKQRRQRNRREFLLTFFSPEDKYQTIELNGFILVKQFDAKNNNWNVAIFTKDSWKIASAYRVDKRQIQQSLLKS